MFFLQSLRLLIVDSFSVLKLVCSRKNLKLIREDNLELGGKKVDFDTFTIHHFDRRGFRFKKILGEQSYDLGLENLRSNLILRRKIDSIKENSNSSGALFDFGTYLQDPLETDFGIFLNDNIALDFDFRSWYVLSEALIRKYDVGLMGLGTNTFLTQSLFFKKFHRPHVQTYLFSVRKDAWENFRKKMNWLLKSARLPRFYGKRALCRFFEQGLTSHIIKEGKRIAIIRNKTVHIFSSDAWNCKPRMWPLENGDFRYEPGTEPFSFRGAAQFRIKIYE